MAFTFKIHDYKNEAGEDICIGGNLLNSEYVNSMLESAGSADCVFDISSVGGDVWAGISMYDSIKKNGKADTRIGALAASSASIIAMGGRKVSMSKYGLLMIHKPMVGSGGNADELLKDVNMLNTIQSRIAQIYMDKTGLDAITINSLINSVTWLTADQALDLGFIDEVEDYAVEATNHAIVKPFIQSASAAYKQVFNKLTIETEEMKTEDKELIEQNNGLFTKVMNFFKKATILTPTNKGKLKSFAPLNVGVSVLNEDDSEVEDGEDYQIDNATGKKIKMAVKDGVVASMDDEEVTDQMDEEEKATNVVLNSVNLKVTNKAEAAGIAKVVSNHVTTINSQNALIAELTGQLKVSNAAVERDEAKIKEDIKTEFTPSGSKRSTIGAVDTDKDKFKPAGTVAQNAVKRALGGAPGIVK